VHPGVTEAIRVFQRGDLDRARELTRRQLEIEADSPPLNHLMGLIECRSGNLHGGVDYLRRASTGDPDNRAYRVMLVRALVDIGRAAEALEAACRPPGSSVADLPLWQARAEAADAAGDLESAAEAWRVLCSARPDDWRGWSNYGESLAAKGRWSEAADALGRAARLNPGEDRIRRNLASALGHSGEHERSLAEFEQLIRGRPDDAELRVTQARLLADLGRTEESMAELEEAARLTVGAASAAHHDEALIEIAGDDAAAVRELALLLDRTNRIAALRKLLEDAAGRGIAPEQLGYPAAAMALRDGRPQEAKCLLEAEPIEADPVRWHRLMAKIADALDQPGTAFAEADAMNRAVHDYPGWREAGRKYRAELRQLASAIGAWPNVTRVGDEGRPSPAFLVGFPRSGTTLADTFLMGHPAVEMLEEVPALAAAEDALGGVLQLPAASAEQLAKAREAYFAIVGQQVEAGFEGLLIDKLPLNMTRLPLIDALFPNARIIFAQRHPCDSVLSGFMQGFVLNPAMASFLDLSDAADLYDAAMDLFFRSRASLPLEVHTLVYEELIEDPRSALQPVVDFLGLDWRDGLLDYRTTAVRRGAINTPSYDQVSEPLSRAPAGRWQRYRAQLGPVLPVLLPWAARLGCAPSDRK
jgi:predicted Zn-dependent protease